ncbi:replication initiation protein [Gordonia phage BritBrat]|uniref:Helix-turn-helix DNA binding domain protein n=1 Tax=Gordonia phage BritBrat TaxID=1838064 RepID=A0A166Y0V7_9CAUD|nr:replication initiation protein [Gordonia phage BritBrat]ANA85290.1 helix-turn-helix DNA binding domain protein [Gordonia phage BritBrat]
MTWFKVDDGFWSHPKSATLTNDAVALWVRAGAYSCQHLTDGFIKTAVLRLLGEPDAAGELVESGLWLEASGGWRFHDWDQYQETSDTVKKRREEARERQRKAREAAEKKRRDALGLSHSESRVTDSVTDSVTSLPPTRPDPTRPDRSSSGHFKGEGGGANRAKNEPPPPKCPKHINSEFTPACGQCKEYRLARERWDTQHINDGARSLDEARTAKKELIDSCSRCDEAEWILEENEHGEMEPSNRKCSHGRRSA